MDTENIKYGDLIHRRAPFVVPPHQRAYAWNDDDIDDFIKDIKVLANKRTTDNSHQHFFGGIVCVNHFVPESPEGNRYLIIDGQQRLATFSMVLALIVRELEQIAQQGGEQQSAHAKNIRARYLEDQSVDDQGQELNQPRLVLSKVDKDFFADLLWNPRQPKSTRASHRLLKRAWKKIHEGLIEDRSSTEMSLEDRRTNLLNLQTVITDGCHMIHIISNDQREAYRLFMTLNDRGKGLSAGDLLKSHTLELLQGHDDSQENVEENWREILKVGDKNVEAFLRVYLPSRIGERAGRLTLYDDFRDKIFGFDGSISQTESKQISNEIHKMLHESITYNKIVKGDWPYEDSTTSMWDQNRLKRLSEILKHALCYPLLLAAKHRLPEDRFAEVVQILELFIFRYVVICKAHAGKLADTYYKHCLKIREQAENYSVEDLRNGLKALIVEDASDSLFKNNLVERLIYSGSAQVSRRILHFLSTLEDYRTWYDGGAQGKPRPNTTSVFDISSLEVEHIYPQKAKIINNELEPLKHDLGNLSFWSADDNKAASNANFSQKKAMYANSRVSLNRDLANLDTWDQKALQKRRKQLVDMAVKIFTI